MPQSLAPVAVPDIPEARVTVPEVHVPAGCRTSLGNGAVLVATILFSLPGTGPVKPLAQCLCSRWLGTWPGSGRRAVGMDLFEVQACCVFTLASLRCTGNQRALLPGCRFIYYGHSSGCPRCEKKVTKPLSAAVRLQPCQPCSALIPAGVLQLRAALSRRRMVACSVPHDARPVQEQGGLSQTCPATLCQEKLLMDTQPNARLQALPALAPGCPSLVASSLDLHLSSAKQQ